MKFMIEGGLTFTLPILLLGIAALVLFIYLLVRKLGQKAIGKKQIDLILFFGSFAFFMGLLGQIVGMYAAADAIQQAGDISQSLIWGGFRVSLIVPIMGFIILLISSIFWIILKPRN